MRRTSLRDGHPTAWRFAHWGSDDQGRYLRWASGVGEIDRMVREGSADAREILAMQAAIDNELVDEGESAMLDVFFRNGTAPGFHFALYNDTPVDTDTLATLVNEVSGGGYARIAVARNTTDFPTLALDAGDFQVSSVTKTFNATGTWTAATILALVEPLTGTAGDFYAWASLSATRNLVNGDSLDASMDIKLG